MSSRNLLSRVSGLSPFMGDTDLETMANVTIAGFDYEDEAFDKVPAEGGCEKRSRRDRSGSE